MEDENYPPIFNKDLLGKQYLIYNKRLLGDNLFEIDEESSDNDVHPNDFFFDNNIEEENDQNESIFDIIDPEYNHYLEEEDNGEMIENNQINDELFGEIHNVDLIDPPVDYEKLEFIPFEPFEKNRIDQSFVTNKIEECASKYLFPQNINLEWFKNYFNNTSEHKHLNDLRSNGNIPYHYFEFDQNHFKIPEERNEMYKLLFSLNFHSDLNATKQKLEDHEALAQDFFGSKFNLSKIPKHVIPVPKKIFYCDNHLIEGIRLNSKEKKSVDFKFFKESKCTFCDKNIDPSQFLLLYDGKEATSFHLFLQSHQDLQGLVNYNLEQRRKLGISFDLDTDLCDFDTGLLTHIARERGFYDNVDISLATLFNHDAVNTNRKANLYKNVTPFFLLNCNLPINKRFKRENLILLGFYCGEKKG